LLAFANGKAVLLIQQYLRRIIISFMATTISTMVLAIVPLEKIRKDTYVSTMIVLIGRKLTVLPTTTGQSH
jgi:hypothetical protein